MLTKIDIYQPEINKEKIIRKSLDAVKKKEKDGKNKKSQSCDSITQLNKNDKYNERSKPKL